MNPFTGIRVMDLSRYLSGPAAAMMLADLGANVIKVETLPGGDPARESGPRHGDQSVYYLASNRNKRGLAVDARDPRGRDLLVRLASTVDVVIENFKPGTATAMGLGPERLLELAPHLVYCSISGFGQRGAGRQLPGFDQTAQAMSGLMSLTGTDATGPLRFGVAVTDSVSGVVAAFGIGAKLYERAQTGRGGVVEASLMESGVMLLSYQAQLYLSLQQIPARYGNDHPLMFPQGTFRTKNGAITLASGNEKMWRLVASVLGLDDLADDWRYAANAGRMEHRHELRDVIERVLSADTSAAWIERFQAAGVPTSMVLDVRQALTHEVSESLGMIATIAHSTIGNLDVLAPPLRLAAGANSDRDPTWLRYPPPTLGEHSREIAAEAGLTTAEIDRLIDEGVLLQSAAPGWN